MNYDEYLEEMQENILHYLEKGNSPWHKTDFINALNGESKKSYNGFNNLLLSMVADRYFDGDPRFYTERQVKEMGLKLKEGEQRSFPVYYFQSKGFRKVLDKEGKPVLDKNGYPTKEQVSFKPVFMTNNVYNAKQIDGLQDFRQEDFTKDPINAKFIEKMLSGHRAENIEREKRHYNSEAEFYTKTFYDLIADSGKYLGRDVAEYQSPQKHQYHELIGELGTFMLLNRANIKYSQSDIQPASIFQESSTQREVLINYLSDFDHFKELYEAVDRSVTYLTNPERRAQLRKEANKDFPDHPFVEFTFSESNQIYENKILPFKEANNLIRKLNESHKEETGYDKTGFKIYWKNKEGQEKVYEGRYDIGSDSEDLFTHIEDRAKYYIEKDFHSVYSKEEVADIKGQYQDVLDNLIPYLKENLSEKNKIKTISTAIPTDKNEQSIEENYSKWELDQRVFNSGQNRWYKYKGKNHDGETLRIHASQTDYTDEYGKKTMKTLASSGYLKEPLNKAWNIDTYVTDTMGNQFKDYNPTVKMTTDGSNRTTNYDWRLEATEDNLKSLLDEIEIRFLKGRQKKQIPYIPYVVIKDSDIKLDMLDTEYIKSTGLDKIKTGEKMSLNAANWKLSKLNDIYSSLGQKSSVSLDIKYQHNNSDYTFSSKYFPGKEIQGERNAIQSHISQYAEMVISSNDGRYTSEQKSFQSKVVKNLIVPYLNLHQEINSVEIKAKQNNPNAEYQEYLNKWIEASRANAALTPVGVQMKSLLSEEQYAIAKKIDSIDLKEPMPISKNEPYIIIGKSTDETMKEGLKLSLFDALQYFDKSAATALLNPDRDATYAKLNPVFPCDKYDRSYWFRPWKEYSPTLDKNQRGEGNPTQALIDYLNHREAHINQTGQKNGISDYLNKHIKLTELERCMKSNSINDKEYTNYINLYIRQSREKLGIDPNANLNKPSTPAEYRELKEKGLDRSHKLLAKMQENQEAKTKTPHKR